MSKFLNLGAGTDVRPKEEGWVNADIRALNGIDTVCDARQTPFADGEFERVDAIDLLEHIPPAETSKALTEWRRILQAGGILKLRFPDIKKITRKFLSGSLGEEEAIGLIYGDQSSEAGGYEWGGHKTALTEKMIRDLLTSHGFEVVSIESPEHEHNLVLEGRKL